jgi:hypothetical protein
MGAIGWCLHMVSWITVAGVAENDNKTSQESDFKDVCVAFSQLNVTCMFAPLERVSAWLP